MDGVEAERALNLLIHDLRAPLSVAQGYLRLLRENRLAATDEREQAFTQTMNALGRIGRICDDAARFTAEQQPTRPPAAPVEMETVVARVERACSGESATTLSFSTPSKLNGTLRVGPLDEVTNAVAEILCAAHRSARFQPRSVLVTGANGEAQFLLGRDEDHAALLAGPVEPFDPWRGGHGIALPLACRTVANAGGRVWTAASAKGSVGIALPAEALFS